MASHYVRQAVKQLALYIRTNLPGHLRTVETNESLTASSLLDPIEVLEANAPNDNRSPLVQVFADGWEYLDHRNHIIAVDCTVALNFTGTLGIAALTATVEHYISGLLACLTTSRTLGGTVMQALPTDGERATVRGDDSLIRQVFAQGVTVTIQES